MVTSSSRNSGAAGHVALWGVVAVLCYCCPLVGTHPAFQNEEMPPHFDSYTSTVCYSQGRGSLTLTCPDPTASMVRIERVAYHHSSSGSCLPSPAHCSVTAEELEVVPCVGRGACTLNTAAGGHGPELRACGGHRATYMTVRFQCIPVSEVVDVCSTRKLTSQWGFIASPRYPLNYLPNAACALHVRTPHPSQRLSLTLIDLRLENPSSSGASGAGAGCSDWLQLDDGHRSETYCNVRANHPAMTTMGNWVDVVFTTDAANQTWKGFWLYYEAFPYIDTPHYDPPETTTLQPLIRPQHPPTTTHPLEKASVVPKFTNITSKAPPAYSEQQRQQARDSLTVGIVVGVVLGVLLCITVVLAVVLVLRK